jgi:hypothetical protein
MVLNVLSIGILFNALVSAVVAGVALALVLFLHRRWPRLDPSMRAYTWFWWMTVLVWLPSAIRYLLAGVGYAGPWLHHLDVTVQAAVFFSGPPLFVYLSRRVFKNDRLGDSLASASFLLGLVALWFVLQPGGVPIRDVTFFSADATINVVSFAIFALEIAAVLVLLLYDVGSRVQRWRQERQSFALYDALYSVAIVVYVVLGSVDESKVITSWPLVAFRLLYSSAFLMVYLIMIQEEAFRQRYLVPESSSGSHYGG